MKTLPPPTIVPVWVIYSAFTLGLLTAIALRAIIVANHVNPTWVRPLWYFGVTGNFVFFCYRFKISRKRKKAVEDFGLIELAQNDTRLNHDTRSALLYILNSNRKSLENLNYLVIFIFSLLAIALDIAMS